MPYVSVSFFCALLRPMCCIREMLLTLERDFMSSDSKSRLTDF